MGRFALVDLSPQRNRASLEPLDNCFGNKIRKLRTIVRDNSAGRKLCVQILTTEAALNWAEKVVYVHAGVDDFG